MRLDYVVWLPPGFSDLSLWTAVMAIILLVTSELLAPQYGKTGINIDRLRLVALIVAFIFLVTVAYRVHQNSHHALTLRLELCQGSFLHFDVLLCRVFHSLKDGRVSWFGVLRESLDQKT
jgi:hypothetical protein